MKNTFLLFFMAMTLSGNKPGDSMITYDISTAIERGIISHEFTGYSDSPHYYQPILIHIKNLTDEPVRINIPVGQTFISDSKVHQDVIVTKEELITLSGHQDIEKALFGMCIQKSNSAPDKDESYHLGEWSNDNLLKLTKEIQNRKAYNYIGQNSIWALTDDIALNEINGFDKKEATHLKTFVAELLGVPVPDYPEDDFYLNYDSTKIKRRVGGKFRYTFSKISSVTIGMFDSRNIIVRELYSNPTAAPGERILKYEFDVEVYTDEVYYIRLIIDGQIKINFELIPRTS